MGVPRSICPPGERPAPLRAKLKADSRRQALREAGILAVRVTELIDRWVAEGAAMQTERMDGASSFAESAAIVCRQLADLRNQLAKPEPLHNLSLDALIGMRSLREIIEIDRAEAVENCHPLIRRNADILATRRFVGGVQRIAM